jgi:uncharacterized membrane protein YbhN (UPF0104 family)
MAETEEEGPAAEQLDGERLGIDEHAAKRNLIRGLVSVLILIVMAVGLLLAVPSLHDVGHEVVSMPIGWVVLALVLELLSCVGYIIAFLQVFERAPLRFGARVALSELAFGAAVSVGGAGSVAVGAWLLIERGGPPGRVAERSAVLFLLTSAVNLIVLAVAGLGAWVGLLPGTRNPLLSLLPGAIGLVVFAGFLLLPWIAGALPGNHGGRVASWARVTSETIVTTARLLFSMDWRLVGAFGYLLLDIAVLYVCFRALGHTPPVSTVILAYQIGYLSNFLPVPGGIGVLDGSFVGMFVLYGVNDTLATSATIVYHAITLWVPAVWGTGAFLALRRSRKQPLTLRPPRSDRA